MYPIKNYSKTGFIYTSTYNNKKISNKKTNFNKLKLKITRCYYGRSY